MIGRIILGVLVLGALSSGSSSRTPKKRASVKRLPRKRPVPALPAPLRFSRIACERRIVEERVEHDDYGVLRAATRYAACGWDPSPWTLMVWTDEEESAEAFVLSPHPDVSEADLRVSVLWSSSRALGDKNFRSYARDIDRDERFQNRLIHRYREDACALGTFLVDVTFQDEKVSFFHRPKSLGKAKLLIPDEPTVALSPPNPFDERIAQFILLQEQYEGAQERIRERKLPEGIEVAALTELEEIYQDEVAAFEGEKSGGK